MVFLLLPRGPVGYGIHSHSVSLEAGCNCNAFRANTHPATHLKDLPPFLVGASGGCGTCMESWKISTRFSDKSYFLLLIRQGDLTILFFVDL